MWEKSPFLCVPSRRQHGLKPAGRSIDPPEQGDGPARSVGWKERAGNGGKGSEVWGRIWRMRGAQTTVDVPRR